MAAWETYVAATGEEFYRLSRAMELDTVNGIMLGEAKIAFDEFQKSFDTLLEFNKDGAARASTVAEIAFYVIIAQVIVVSVLSIFVGLRVAKFIIESITAPVKELQMASRELTAGNLDAEIQYESEDELGELADNFREAFQTIKIIIKDSSRLLAEMAEGNFDINTEHEESYVGAFTELLAGMRNTNRTLDATLKKINEASEQVSEGSGHLADGAQALADGATDQAGAIQELTATIESVTGISEESYKNAAAAASNAKEAGAAAGAAEASRVQTDMLKQIEDGINQISEVVQSNSASAEETSAISEELSAQSEALKEMVAQFKLRQ